MKSHTQTKVFSATKETVFSFLSDIRNLTKWAIGFAKELKEIDGEYRMVAAQNRTLAEEVENIRKHVEERELHG